MIFDQDCDLIRDEQVCSCDLCMRFELCQNYYSRNPDRIYCADDIKKQLILKKTEKKPESVLT